MSSRISIDFGVVYHVIARFVGSQWFIPSDVERRVYLFLLGMSLKYCDWRCLSYAVMSNHIHLAMLAGHDSLASWTREVHRPFAEWTNERLERIGAVFTRGPKAIAVRPEGVAPLLAYIHRNPVRAGVVKSAKQSTWTSHQFYIADADQPAWLDSAMGLRLAGFEDRHDFDRWVDASAVDRAWLDSFARDPKRARGRPRSAQQATDEHRAIAQRL